ncbi:MAG: PspA/IM30 family protein [Pseudomonadota bacterium]
MALVTRLTRLFQADFHAVLDRIEEPDLQLRQAVREMQLALDSDQTRLQLLQQEHAQTGKSLQTLTHSLSDFDEELDICLAANKDDLARDLVRRKLINEKQRDAMQRKGEALENEIDSLEKQIVQQEQQLNSMKQKLELLVREETAQTEFSSFTCDAIRSEEIEIALLREKERRVKS